MCKVAERHLSSESGAVLPLMPPMGLLGLSGRQEAMTLLGVVALMLAMVTVSPLTPIVALGLLVANEERPRRDGEGAIFRGRTFGYEVQLRGGPFGI